MGLSGAESPTESKHSLNLVMSSSTDIIIVLIMQTYYSLSLWGFWPCCFLVACQYPNEALKHLFLLHFT